MNRSEMRAVLASGGTVLHKNKHIRTEADLPSEGELALDNGTEADALSSLYQEVARLTAEKEALEKSLNEKKLAKAAKAEAKSEAKESKADSKADDEVKAKK